MAESIGRYTITSKLGEGGMGVVYAAHDPRLDRTVAIKTVRDDSANETARLRLWREARAAARVSHPNVCQLYEIGEEGGTLFLVMELLQGETLATRIARGPVPYEECLMITLSILNALDALHAQEILHRDLKPTNVFLTPVGIKLLDFGLARPLAGPVDMTITQAGTVVGTPRYMAPELWREEPIGPAADLFAVGAIMYEMLTGRPAFPGNSMPTVYEKILTHEPPPIVGSDAVAGIDAIIHRALRKKSSERFASAAAMTSALDSVETNRPNISQPVAVRSMLRLIALPLRILRPDAETDFLAFSLPDAISNSLAGLDSIAVRSSTVAARFADGGVDLTRIATEADIDVVLSGTLMRAGEQLRISAQLLEAPAGTVLWSGTFQTSIQDVFELQDTLTREIVASLAVPLSSRERDALKRGAPASAQAYEFYLRANQVAYDARQWELARDLYRQCLDLDPGYAPAWARLGRLYRAISIYTGSGHEDNYRLSQEAFRRALEIDPDLSVAHNLYTHLEVELGHAQDAMLRLLERARVRTNDPELFAGLVQACRYCGLLDASIAAFERARRIDPKIRTSVAHAYFMRHDYQNAVNADLDDPPFISVNALGIAGRVDEALALLAKRDIERLPRLLQDIFASTRLLLEGRTDEARPVSERLAAAWRSRDPCAAYYVARQLARSGVQEDALLRIARTVDDGFYVPSFLATDPWLDSLRDAPEFARTLARARERHAEAARAFAAAGGDRILGLR